MGNIVFTANDDGTCDAVGKQGATWQFRIELKDSEGAAINLTDYLGRGQIRKNYLSTDITKSFTVTVVVPETDGKVDVLLAATDTDDIKRGRYVYDIEVYTANDAHVLRILQGKLLVDPEVTRP